MNQQQPKQVKILIAKPGLDGHDVGAKVVVRALLDAGFEVIYTGLRKSAEEIVATAIENDVDVIGLSILSGSHLPFCEKFRTLREEHQLADKLWVVGGNIPQNDKAALEALGVDGVFPFGSPLQAIVDFISERVT
jgi:methylmalonyl-CoA mutase C-terminal domain/subunit